MGFNEGQSQKKFSVNVPPPPLTPPESRSLARRVSFPLLINYRGLIWEISIFSKKRRAGREEIEKVSRTRGCTLLCSLLSGMDTHSLPQYLSVCTASSAHSSYRSPPNSICSRQQSKLLSCWCAAVSGPHRLYKYNRFILNFKHSSSLRQ